MKVCISCQHHFDSPGWHCPNCGHSPDDHGHYLSFVPEALDGWEGQFFEKLAEVESGHFWFESRNRLLIWAMQRFAPSARTFLEIGCGTGFVMTGVQAAFPALTVSGAEYFGEGLSFAAQRNPRAAFYQMDARSIPFENEFDVIGAFDVLEHIREDEQALAQIFKALKPGGTLLVTVPQHQFLWSVVDDYSHHQRRYSRTELVSKARSAGFEIACVTSFVSLPLPLMLISRLQKAPTLDNFDPMAEFKISPLVNGVLTQMLTIERSLIKAGLSMPAGGSLLLTARRPV